MRIIYFAHSVLSRGGDKMVLAHLGHLAESGHQVVIRTNVVDTVFPIHPAISVQFIGSGSKPGTLLAALWEMQDADCIIASIIPTAILLSLRNCGKVLYFAQDDNETAYHSPLLRSFIRFLYFLSFALMKIPTITVSTELAKIFRKRFGADCEVVENGVDTKSFFPDSVDELRLRSNGRKSILLFSRSDPRKGFDVARQVVSRLAAKGAVPIEIWTVGEEVVWEDASFTSRHFGYVSEAKLRSIISSSDVFLYPSRSEGFPLMVLEAFACKCPVVTTDAVAYARHGENALVCRVGDIDSLVGQLLRVLTDSDFAASIIEKGYQFVQNYRLEQSQALFEVKLTSLLSKGNTIERQK